MIKRPLVLFVFFYALGLFFLKSDFTIPFIITIISYAIILILSLTGMLERLIYKKDFFFIFLPLVFLFSCLHFQSGYDDSLKKLEIYEEYSRTDKEYLFDAEIKYIKKTSNGYLIYLKNVEIYDDENNKEEKIPLPEATLFSTEENAFIRENKYTFLAGIKSQQSPTTPGLFDSKNYALSVRQYGYLYLKSVTCTVPKRRNLFTKACDTVWDRTDSIKNRIQGALDEIYSVEDSGILKAMLTGDKSSLQRDTKDNFQKAGTYHLLAVSGLHLSILIMGMYRLLKNLRFTNLSAVFISLSVLGAFEIICYDSISAKRAGIMCLILFGGILIGRRTDLITSLALSFIITTIINPMAVLGTSFVLSYLSVLAICISKETRVSAGLSVQMVLIPVNILMNNEISTMAYFINVPLLFIAPILLTVSVFSTIAQMLIPGAGVFAGSGVKFMLFLMKKMCELANIVPFSLVPVRTPSLKSVYIYEFVIFFII